MEKGLAIAGLCVLIFAWAGPLPGLVPASFAAHMQLHMSVVGIGVPLLAAGLAPELSRRGWLSTSSSLAIVISVVDLVVVWGWHAPALHHASRESSWVLAVEQANFAIVSFMVWLVALAGWGETQRSAALAGAMTLFFTSMHMTLLGALIGLAPRPIFGEHLHNSTALPVLADQQIGGVIMLAIGGVIYLTGGLILMGRVLRRPATT